jgi:hypothetical protein
LRDDSPKRQKTSIAELSRPNHAVKEFIRQKKTHAQGCKRKHEHKDAVYHNWHGPFTWSQIDAAAKHPAVQWSATRLIQQLKNHNPKFFKNLARSTVEGWIDRSGNKPQWSEAALRMAELGNHQGHSNGGQRGVFVCAQLYIFEMIH